jgi:hypothetical protein
MITDIKLIPNTLMTYEIKAEAQLRIKATMMTQLEWFWCMFNMRSLAKDYACTVTICNKKET